MSTNLHDREFATGSSFADAGTGTPVLSSSQLPAVKQGIELPDSEARESVGRQCGSESSEDIEDQKLAASAAARHARSAFKSACENLDPDYSENQYFACRDALEELWHYSSLRTRAFRDLLAVLEAAVKSSPMSDFDDTQRSVLQLAFGTLTRAFVDERDVEKHIQAFAEFGIDITSPIVENPTARKFRVIIEECD